MRPTKTLCKYCNKCEDFEYVRFDKNGNLQCFQYCKGGAEEVRLSEWYIQKDGYPYSTKRIDGKKTFYHTLFKRNEWLMIDHINGDRTDNRLRMLREISPSENSQNHMLWKDRRRISKYPGVYYNRKKEKWYTVATKNNYRYNRENFVRKEATGFNTEEEAFEQYLKFLKELGRDINTETESYKDYLKWKGEQQQVSLDIF